MRASPAAAGEQLPVTVDARASLHAGSVPLVACPCGVGLSTPTPLTAAIGNGARRGILIESGAHLEVPERILANAANSEVHSRHPLAQAVIRSTEERRVEIPPHEEWSRELLLKQQVPISWAAHEWVRRLQQNAETPLLLAVDGKLIGLISLRDTTRPGAREVLTVQRADGVRCLPGQTDGGTEPR